MEIVSFVLSPAHAYEGRPSDGPSRVTTTSPGSITLRAGYGVVGDRYAGARAALRGRAGIRAAVLGSGTLHLGPLEVDAAVELDPARAGPSRRVRHRPPTRSHA